MSPPLTRSSPRSGTRQPSPWPPGSRGAKAGTAKRTVGHMLQAIADTPFFGNAAQRVVIWFLKQVHRYVTEPDIRRAAQQSLINRIGTATRVVVAHSLGSVVAYETLCAHPEFPSYRFSP